MISRDGLAGQLPEGLFHNGKGSMIRYVWEKSIKNNFLI